MRHEDAGLALWLAKDESKREQELSCERLITAQAALELARPSLRQRAGAAVIGLGERLAGERPPAESRPVRRRRLAGQAS